MDFSLIENLANEETNNLYNSVIEDKISHQLWCFECANGIYACYCDYSGTTGVYAPNSKGTFTFYYCGYGNMSTLHACGKGITGYGFQAGYCSTVGNQSGTDRC